MITYKLLDVDQNGLKVSTKSHNTRKFGVVLVFKVIRESFGAVVTHVS